jgi:chaperonin GroEL (HSP60 family)
MDVQKMDDNMQVQFSSAQEFQSYRQQVNRDDWVAKADAIAKHLPNGGVIVVRDNVNEIVASMLARKNIAVVQRVPESDMVALGHLLGISPAHTPEDIALIASMGVEQKTIGDMNYVVIEGDEESSVITLVLRGATRQTLDETERGFADALGVVSIAYKSGKVVSGGGSAYMAMARYLRERATDIGGRAQMAVDAFAEGLESIPATIAENAGHVPLLDTVLSLRGAHEVDNHHWGPDIAGPSGTICNMAELGVWEPLDLVRQVVLSATEVSTSILRIDDIMAKKSDGAPPQQTGFGMQQM